MSIGLIVTRGYGNGTLTGDIAHVVTRGYTVAESIWSDAGVNASIWRCAPTGATTWDAATTQWDLTGNVYMTEWDKVETTYSDASTNSPTWSDV